MSGGNNGQHSAATKLKLSQNKIGDKNHFYGKHHSDETKIRISEANKNPSEETKIKRRKASEANKGRKYSKEELYKMSIAKKRSTTH